MVLNVIHCFQTISVDHKIIIAVLSVRIDRINIDENVVKRLPISMCVYLNIKRNRKV